MSRLRIMISSTIKDLEPERTVVAKAIADFRFERFRSESMGALSRSPETVCDEMARECDIYILIVGASYGWVIPHSNISVTEREYDVARASDPEKILVYVKNLPDGAREPRQEIFLNKATDFRTGYFRAKPFDSSDELATRVKDDLSILISDRIHSGQLSVSKVFALPQPAELFRYAFYFVLLLFASTFAIGMLGTQQNYFPNVSKITMAAMTNAQKLVISSVRSNLFALYSYSAALVIAASLIAATNALPIRARLNVLKLITIVAFIASIFSFTMVDALFGYGWKFSIILKATIPSVTLLLYAGISHMLDIASICTANLKTQIAQVFANLLLSSAIPNAFLLTCAFSLFNDFLFPFAISGLGALLMDARMMMRRDLEIAGLFSLIFSSGCIYFLIRLIQSEYGWSYIIRPALLSHAHRKTKL
jgi:ABC-type nitrate/sulfonate/bicarbonate transport system permease component